jgi:hypothetical protein
MPPKQFLSSKTADIWNDRKPSAPPEKKRKKDDRNEVDDIDLRVTGEHLRQLVQRGAARSERSSLAQELTDMKKLKGTNQAKPFNYADLQKKQKKLKVCELFIFEEVLCDCCNRNLSASSKNETRSWEEDLPSFNERSKLRKSKNRKCL